jgi:D-amino-acid dehydrogenase
LARELTKDVDVLVIGAGVIGVCSAYYLLKAGREVTIVDREGVAAGSSFGNSGLIVPSHSIPLAAPGIISKGLRWLIDPGSPFYVKPRLSRELASWMWRFQAAARRGPMERSVPVLADLTLASAEIYRELIPEEGIECHYIQRGMLGLYSSKHGLAEGTEEANIMRRHGVGSRMLSPEEVVEIEPTVKPGIKGGVLYETDSNLEPASFVQAMADRVIAMGGKIETGQSVDALSTTGRQITEVLAGNVRYRPQEVVLAAGSWSPQLGKQLGVSLPVQPAKGYSITVTSPKGAKSPGIPLMAHEARVGVAPMGPDLRLAGTLELSGLNTNIDKRRVRAIVKGLSRYVTGIEDTPVTGDRVWCGMRPCTPDGLPIIGRPGSLDNIVIATGHAMIGMTLGPITGRLVSQIAARAEPEINTEPVSPDRFA